jgi:hypothetical protein
MYLIEALLHLSSKLQLLASGHLEEGCLLQPSVHLSNREQRARLSGVLFNPTTKKFQ